MGCVIAPDRREDYTVELILLRRHLHRTPVEPSLDRPESASAPLTLSTSITSESIEQFGLQAGGLWYSYRPQIGLECVRLGYGTPVETTPGVSFPVHPIDDPSTLSARPLSSDDYGRYLSLRRKYSDKGDPANLANGETNMKREDEHNLESVVILRRIRLGRVVGDVLSQCTSEMLMLEEWQPTSTAEAEEPSSAKGLPTAVYPKGDSGPGAGSSSGPASGPSDKEFCLFVCNRLRLPRPLF
jgi:hypothetical protein